MKVTVKMMTNGSIEKCSADYKIVTAQPGILFSSDTSNYRVMVMAWVNKTPYYVIYDGIDMRVSKDGVIPMLNKSSRDNMLLNYTGISVVDLWKNEKNNERGFLLRMGMTEAGSEFLAVPRDKYLLLVQRTASGTDLAIAKFSYPKAAKFLELVTMGLGTNFDKALQINSDFGGYQIGCSYVRKEQLIKLGEWMIKNHLIPDFTKRDDSPF